jgi:hypothetical protein
MPAHWFTGGRRIEEEAFSLSKGPAFLREEGYVFTLRFP